MRSWVEFWDSEHAIYVNARHKQLHAEAVGRDIVRHIPSPHAHVLDYGCADALYAEEVARHCARLVLSDAADKVRQGLAERTRADARIAVLDPAAVARLPAGSFDLIVANSLLQYLAIPDLEALLDVWRDKLKPDGRLVIADVIPPGVSPVTDAAALLRFAWTGGFLVAAVMGLARTALSDYGRIRKRLGFSMHEEAAFVSLLRTHGLAAERVHPNFGHNQARMTFSARRI